MESEQASRQESLENWFNNIPLEEKEKVRYVYAKYKDSEYEKEELKEYFTRKKHIALYLISALFVYLSYNYFYQSALFAVAYYTYMLFSTLFIMGYIAHETEKNYININPVFGYAFIGFIIGMVLRTSIIW